MTFCFFPQLCHTPSCADMERAREVEPRLEVYKIHTTKGERTRALGYLQGRTFYHKSNLEIKGSDSRHELKDFK